MASILCLNPKAELARHAAALELNVSGAKGLMEVMRTNLGPKGTMKMFVCHFTFSKIRIRSKALGQLCWGCSPSLFLT